MPDERSRIREMLIDWCDDLRLNLIFTTGGTGCEAGSSPTYRSRGIDWFFGSSNGRLGVTTGRLQ
ncbi:MAG: hypothetical protein QHJ73_10040 [Armatimonadota bacterium]|nr:hypothetical protein [Armatimonadota bacterium]